MSSKSPEQNTPIFFKTSRLDPVNNGSDSNTTFNLSRSRLTMLVSLWLVLFYNLAFFRHVVADYPFTFQHALFIGSLALFVTAMLSLVLATVTFRQIIKPLFILLLLVSSLAAYFMDNYNTVIDSTMLQNAAMTDSGEALDLFSFELVLYFLLLGVAPSLFIYKLKIKNRSSGKELVSKSKLVILALVIITSQLLIFGKSYASFFREHKSIRYYSNPLFYIFSAGKYAHSLAGNNNVMAHPLGLDAHISATDDERELIIFVLGETARADHFALNGYSKQTNPYLQHEEVISFSKLTSCGTSTAVSVPCMFSVFDRSSYSDKHAYDTENLLDVLNHAGVHILWRDNNSDSKGVALRVPYEDFKSPETNHNCDDECRDEGMLEGIQNFITRQKTGDIFIVLHQMGNHGPAYYKRYPKSFEKFVPVCHTNQLEECGETEIQNAYDNAILYTDYFLSKVIGLLKNNSDEFETAMVYVSDHGESLGEKGLYLHGLPYFMAPDEQKNPAAILWFGEKYDDIDKKKLQTRANQPISHDHVFHTVLGMMEIETSVYDKNMDILHNNRGPDTH